jgi:hypothetical protein
LAIAADILTVQIEWTKGAVTALDRCDFMTALGQSNGHNYRSFLKVVFLINAATMKRLETLGFYFI